LNTARSELAGAGTQTAALAFGGATAGPSSTGATEEYDGTSWTSSPYKFKYSKICFSRSRNTNSRISFWWDINPPPVSSATEEWTGAGAPLTQTITVS
jgi:hypothetical protein